MKVVFGYNAAADCPISAKFCVGKPKSVTIAYMSWRTAAILKIV